MKMELKRNRVFECICAFFILFSSCTPPMEPPEPKIGDDWIYHCTSYDSNGVVLSEADITYHANERVYNNAPWAQVDNGDYLETEYIEGTLRMEYGGLWRVISTSINSYPVHWLKYPGAVGEGFSYNVTGTSSPTIYWNIASITDSLDVPLGHFDNLYKYTQEVGGVSCGNLWFNDSVWFVKYELYADSASYIYKTYELVSYTAN